ncbi:MAG: NUDIX hydrolase [Chlamydiales bacterium]
MIYQYKNPQTLFHGKRVDLLSIEVDHQKREVVSHPGAVVILPLLDAETVVLIRNERYVVQKTLWELPAGTLEKDESPLSCARRELEEETGYQAGSISPLLEFYSTPGFCNEILYTFLAQDLTYVGQNLDDTEKIEVHTLKLTRAIEMIHEGTICDAKTICALLFYQT